MLDSIEYVYTIYNWYSHIHSSFSERYIWTAFEFSDFLVFEHLWNWPQFKNSVLPVLWVLRVAVTCSARCCGTMTSAEFFFTLVPKTSHSKVLLNTFDACCQIYTPSLRENFWTSSFIAELSPWCALYLISVRQHFIFALRLPSDSSSQKTPLPLASDSLSPRLTRDLHPIVSHHVWHTNKKGAMKNS